MKNPRFQLALQTGSWLAALALSVIGAAWLPALNAAKPAAEQGAGSRAILDGQPPDIELGPRPRTLIEGLTPGPLKQALQACASGPFKTTDFSIAHRGAPREFPEHTAQSYQAAARQGAGIVECDVTFTRDGHLVCRHAECDLHTTTDILVSEAAAHCSIPFTPFDAATGQPATARCCTSDLSLAQFQTLKGKRHYQNPRATTPRAFVGELANHGTVLSHRQSIQLLRSLGVKFTPELKAADPQRLRQAFNAATTELAQQRYAQAMIDDYRQAGIAPTDVWPQSFDLADVTYWIEHAGQFGRQAVYLDGRTAMDPFHGDPRQFVPTMDEIAGLGVKIIAPPMHFLLRVEDDGNIVPSTYAHAAKQAGLQIITWTLERSDLRHGSRTGGLGQDGLPRATYYYQFDRNPNAQAIRTESDLYRALDALARRVGILGIFSDWPATVTYYANCMGLD